MLDASMDLPSDGSSVGEHSASDAELSIVSIEITDEPLDEPHRACFTDKELSRLKRITERMYDDPAGQYEELVGLVEAHPDVPILRNHLACALSAKGRHEEAEALHRETHERFPDYVFGFVNYVSSLLDRGDLDRAGELLEGEERGPRLFIKAFAPDREVFHSTEVVCYAGMVARYLAKTGRIEGAETSLDMMHDVLPEHPLIGRVELEIEQALLERMMKSITSLTGRGKKGKGGSRA